VFLPDFRGFSQAKDLKNPPYRGFSHPIDCVFHRENGFLP